MAATKKTSVPARQQEFEHKLAQIRTFLKNRNLGGVYLSTQALFAWATAGGDNHVSMSSEFGVASLLVTPDKVTVLTNNIEAGRVAAEEFSSIQSPRVEFWSCPWHTGAALEAELKKRMAGREWASDSGIAGSQRLGEDFNSLTYVLTGQEIERYRTLGRDCSLAMEEALEDVRPGVNEQSVAGLICQRLWDHSVRPHVILIASDERVFNFRHPIPKNKRIRKHLLAVLCGKRGGLIINLTRMIHFSKKLPDELRRKHDACCAVDMAFNLATVPGRKMSDVFAAGVAEYERQGFGDEWKLHHQGGPTGYHGRCFLGTPSEERVVHAGQAYAWNPSITGTKSEDTILALDGGIEFLSAPTKAWPALQVKSGGKKWKRADIKLV